MRSMSRRTGFGILLLSLAAVATPLAPGAPAAAQAPFPADEDLDVMLRYLVEDGATPGIVFGIVEADGSTRVLEAGSGGPGTRPLGPRSVFEIGSINKTFTGTLLAEMVARGEVALEDPVSQYMPDSVRVPSLNGRQITLLDLATHRSGLPGLPDNFLPGDLANPYADYTLQRLYAFLSSHELRREPGAGVEYSNLGFGLLGHALARAAGTTYQALVRERILEPLGMDHTGWSLEGEGSEWLTKGHADGEVVSYWSATEAIYGAGGLRSSLADMLKYLAANLGPPRTDLERAMREAQRPRRPFDEDEQIGLGWRTEGYDGRTIVKHGGASAGFSARIAFDPERRVGFVRLANTGDYPDDMGLDFLRTGPPLDLATTDVPPDVLARYVGTYELRPDVRFFVRLEDDGALTVQPGRRSERLRLYPESDSSFFLKRTPRRAWFTTDAAGEVDALVMELADGPRRLAKVADDTPPPGLPAGPATLDVPLAPEEVAAYEGTYTVRATGRTLEIRVFGREGGLAAQLVGGGATRLLGQGDHAFVLEAERESRLVFTMEGDRATGVVLHMGGRAMSGHRKGEPGPAAPETDRVLDLPVSADDVARYEGTYLLEIGDRTLPLRIFGRGGRLVSQAAGQGAASLRYQGGHVFVPDFDDRVRLVFTVEGDRATAVTLHQGGGVFHGARQP